MKLIKHELYKIFSRKFTLVALILSIILLQFMVYNHLINRTADEENYKRLENMTIDEVKAEIKEFNSAMEKGELEKRDTNKLITDERFLNYQAIKNNQPIEVLDFDDERIIKQYTKDLINKEMKNNSKNSYKNKELTIIKEKLDNRNISEFKYNPREIIVDIQRLTLVLSMMLILVAISPIFSSEYKNNMSFLILSSKYGRTKGVLAKIISYIIVDILFYTILNLSAVIAYKIAGGSKFLEGNYQDIFENSYMNSSLKTVYIQIFFIGLLSLVAFTTIIALTSQITKNSLIPIFIGIVLQAVDGVTNSIKPLFFLKIIGFTNYGKGGLLNKISFVNILSSPVNLVVIVTIMMLVIFLVGNLIIIRMNKRVKLA